jgi:hypothetical protein
MQKDHSEGHWTQGKEAPHHNEGRVKERRLPHTTRSMQQGDHVPSRKEEDQTS